MPTDQRAGVKPIAFVLDNGGKLGEPVTLKIRPEDIVANQPGRVAVHQTMGRTVQGWVDDFGSGLPSLTISGHTGWRTSAASGLDGAQAFEALNNLLMIEYPAAKQAAIDSGNDPAAVKLLFIDMLNNLSWSVAVTNFSLKRNKSHPLLYMYNIPIQAIEPNIDNPLTIVPFQGDIPAGVEAMSSVVSTIQSLSADVQTAAASAAAAAGDVLEPVASTVGDFLDTSTAIMNSVIDAVLAVENGVSSVANDAIAIASDIAQVGINISRTLAAVTGLPANIKASLMRVSSAYTEAFCILKNSLRQREVYSDYDGIYGASNCSSTTGGRAASAYADQNVFALIQPQVNQTAVSGSAYSAIQTINRGDPVLSPLSLDEISRNTALINSGIIVPNAA